MVEVAPTQETFGETFTPPPGTEAPGTESKVDAPPAPVAPSKYTHCPEGNWCSSLYQPNWSADAPADAQGRFLHDFSYAGYRKGEQPPAAPPGATHDVVAAGADATGGRDSTGAIQSAINAASAAGGGIVFFPAGTYRIDDRLTVTASGVVLRGTGKGSVLRFTKPSGIASHITIKGAVQQGAKHALVTDAPTRSKEIAVADASDLAPGDDVAVGWTISSAFIDEHGMNGVWTAFNGQFETFFRSKVVSVDTSSAPHKVTLDVPTRYVAKVRDGASLVKETGYLRENGIEHLAVTNAVSTAQAWAENQVNVIRINGVTDMWLDDVHSVQTPGSEFHLRSKGVILESSKRVSILRSSMRKPQNLGPGGNGYLFEVSMTNDVLFADDEAYDGRHNFIQNWGFGNTGTVFLRCTSAGSTMLDHLGDSPYPSQSEHHHSLAMATLVDSSRLDDGFAFENRGDFSIGAGHTATESVVWNATGAGKIKSQQYGWGYVIGTGEAMTVDNSMAKKEGAGTAPADFVEGDGKATSLYPASLYEDQRARRLGQ
jgi:hypothetical protein